VLILQLIAAKILRKHIAAVDFCDFLNIDIRLYRAGTILVCHNNS